MEPQADVSVKRGPGRPRKINLDSIDEIELDIDIVEELRGEPIPFQRIQLTQGNSNPTQRLDQTADIKKFHGLSPKWLSILGPGWILVESADSIDNLRLRMRPMLIHSNQIEYIQPRA